MGYLSKQLEKVAGFNAAEKLVAAALSGTMGAGIGLQNSGEKDRVASVLGGATGGTIGGATGALTLNSIEKALEKSKRFNRLAGKNPTLGILLGAGAMAAPVLGLGGAGAYAGSELAKKLKTN